MAFSPRRFSANTNNISSAAPAQSPKTALVDQPVRPAPVVSAQVTKPNPPVASTPPQTSKVSPLSCRSRGTYSHARAIAAAASGRLIRKIARQLPRSTSHPPSTGPIAAAIAPAAAHTPMARPFAAPENVRPRMAKLFGIRSAAPAPCRRRPPRSQPTVGAIAQATDASAKRPIPNIRTTRWPKRSPAPPPNNSKALNGNKYAFTVHCRPLASASKAAAIAGRLTLTTDPSTNARLEARIVVASTSLGCSIFSDVSARCAATASEGTCKVLLIFVL